MPVNLQAPNPSDLFPVPGIQLGIAMAGVRKANRRDLTVITVPEGAQVAGVFTTNRFCAAPVQLCRKHLAAGVGTRALVINTGNANAGTGEDGLVRAFSTWPPSRSFRSPPVSSWSRCPPTASPPACLRRSTT